MELRDSLVQAICHAAIDLVDSGRPNVRVVCWGPRSVALVRGVLDTGALPDSTTFPVSERTRSLLAKLIPHRRSISVHADTCPVPHFGVTRVEVLAARAQARNNGADGLTEHRVAARVQARDKTAEGPTEHRLVAPDEEREQAWWLTDRTGDGRSVWQTALCQTHLDGRWCALPEGALLNLDQRLRLRVEHDGGGSRGHAVTRRHRDGRWELAGIRWPGGLLPGVLVTFEHRPGDSLITASTTPLPAPERIDGSSGIDTTHAWLPG